MKSNQIIDREAKMSTEIYYFSGTGNSLFAARELQKRIPGAELIPIVSLIHNKKIRPKSEKIGIIFPVHALTLPIVVKQFVEKLDLGNVKYIFSIATRKGTLFRGFEKIDGILKWKRKRLDAHFILDMYTNDSRSQDFLPDTPEEIQTIETRVLSQLDVVAESVINMEIRREKDVGGLIGFSAGPLTSWFLEKMVLLGMGLAEKVGGVQYYYADQKCTGCGICEKVCLSGKIVMETRKPVWNKNVLCTMCWACLNFCPARAVQIHDIPYVKSYTPQNGRYSHPYAMVKDMTEQKRK